MKEYFLDFDRADNQKASLQIKTDQVPDEFVAKFDRSSGFSTVTQQDTQDAKRALEKLRDEGIIIVDFRTINQKYHRLAAYISIIGKQFKQLKQFKQCTSCGQR